MHIAAYEGHIKKYKPVYTSPMTCNSFPKELYNVGPRTMARLFNETHNRAYMKDVSASMNQIRQYEITCACDSDALSSTDKFNTKCQLCVRRNHYIPVFFFQVSVVRITKD